MSWDGCDFVLYPVALDCLPAILRLSGNTSAVGAGRRWAGSRSSSIASPPVLYPCLLRIQCGFVSFPICCPVPSHPCRSPSCLAPPSSLCPASCSRPLSWDAPCGFPAPTAYRHRAPPIVSDGGESYDSVGGLPALPVAVDEMWDGCPPPPAACLLAVVRASLPVRPSAHLPIISSNTPRLPSAYRRPIPSRG